MIQFESRLGQLRQLRQLTPLISRALFTGSSIVLLAFCCGIFTCLFQAQLLDLRYLMLLVLSSMLLSLRFNYCRPILFLSLGLFYGSYIFTLHQGASFASDYESTDFAVTGSVQGLPSNNRGNIGFRFLVSGVDDQRLSNLSGRLLQLSCYRCPLDFAPAQEWRLTVRVKRPHGYASWGSFDYEKYLFRHRVVAKGYVRLKSENQLLAQQAHSLHLWRAEVLRKLSSKVADGVGRNMIAALTVGDKSGFSKSQRDVFQISGVSHLMAISGLHVGLVFLCVSGLFRFLLWPIASIYNWVPRQRLVLIPALWSAFMYSALAGFAVSTQRALVMLLIYVLCRLFAREVSLLKVLLLAASVLLLVDPFAILDMGFWLSCGAVFIIALVTKGSEALALLKLQPLLWLGMMPMSVTFFGQVSLVSPFINLLFVPLFCMLLIPATLLTLVLMMLGFDATSSFIFAQLAQTYHWLYLGLEWVTGFSLARYSTTPFAQWQWALYLALLVCQLLLIKGRLVLLCVLVSTVFLNTAKPLADDELNVVLLDVGQGLAMVIETPNHVLVYDTGPKYSSGFTAAEAVLVPYLRHRGIRRIDLLVISHADNDHIGGYQTVQNAVEVKSVLSSRVDKIPEAQECMAGQEWVFDQTEVRVIGPEPNTPQGSNNRSCVIMLEHQNKRVLISGDIEKRVERYMLNTLKPHELSADVLLVPHQGSKTSSTAEFLDSVSPSIAMLAAGYRNHYGHPHASVVQRYQDRAIELRSTIRDGSLLLKINSKGIHQTAYRKAQRRFWHYQK